MGTTVEEIALWMEQHYPSQLAEQWDKVGLTVGRTTRLVSRILLAVDPVQSVISEAIDGGYDLIITHHPLYLRGTSFITDQTAKGQTALDLAEAGVSLFCAHTNADAAHAGVAEALAQLLGIQDVRPLVPSDLDQSQGLGRIGWIEPVTLEVFAKRVAARLPAGPNGILVGGDLNATIDTVAVSGGAGDSMLLDASNQGADVFVTADLRHHPSQDHLAQTDTALISGSHWATEAVWLPILRDYLLKDFPNIDVDLSTIVTEPWSTWLPTKGSFGESFTS